MITGAQFSAGNRIFLKSYFLMSIQMERLYIYIYMYIYCCRSRGQVNCPLNEKLMTKRGLSRTVIWSTKAESMTLIMYKGANSLKVPC